MPFRTLVAATPAGPGALTIEHRPAHAPEAGQVAVDVGVAGVNPVDAKVLAGAFGPGLFPYVPGCEFSGRVAAVGEGVTSLSVGDRVAALSLAFAGDPGAWQDRVTYPADRLVLVPTNLSDEVVGTNVLLPLTAHRLQAAAGLPAGASAVVPGAAGGVGRWLVQLLVRDGVHVTTITSDADVAALASLGATALSRTDAAALASLAGFDAVFDLVGGDASMIAGRRAWLGQDGRYFSVTGPGEGVEMVQARWDAAALSDLLAGVADGTFEVVDAQLYAPEDAALALGDYLSRTHARTALDFRLGR